MHSLNVPLRQRQSFLKQYQLPVAAIFQFLNNDASVYLQN